MFPQMLGCPPPSLPFAAAPLRPLPSLCSRHAHCVQVLEHEERDQFQAAEDREAGIAPQVGALRTTPPWQRTTSPWTATGCSASSRFVALSAARTNAGAPARQSDWERFAWRQYELLAAEEEQDNSFSGGDSDGGRSVAGDDVLSWLTDK